jgi:hypothetical protein
MAITANIEINNLPEIREGGYEVVINDLGSLWHYGFYTKKDRAIEAVEESDNRFMVEITD